MSPLGERDMVATHGFNLQLPLKQAVGVACWFPAPPERSRPFYVHSRRGNMPDAFPSTRVSTTAVVARFGSRNSLMESRLVLVSHRRGQQGVQQDGQAAQCDCSQSHK